jgi:hypothetical protein
MLNVVHMIHRALNYSKHVFVERMKDISTTELINSVLFFLNEDPYFFLEEHCLN